MPTIPCAPRERLVTATEIADLLSVTPKWVYSACRQYDMPYYQLGRYKRFSPTEVVQWIGRRDSETPDSRDAGRSV